MRKWKDEVKVKWRENVSKKVELKKLRENREKVE